MRIPIPDRMWTPILHDFSICPTQQVDQRTGSYFQSQSQTKEEGDDCGWDWRMEGGIVCDIHAREGAGISAWRKEIWATRPDFPPEYLK